MLSLDINFDGFVYSLIIHTIFGCAANLLTSVLAAFYSIQGSIASRKVRLETSTLFMNQMLLFCLLWITWCPLSVFEWLKKQTQNQEICFKIQLFCRTSLPLAFLCINMVLVNAECEEIIRGVDTKEVFNVDKGTTNVGHSYHNGTIISVGSTWWRVYEPSKS